MKGQLAQRQLPVFLSPLANQGLMRNQRGLSLKKHKRVSSAPTIPLSSTFIHPRAYSTCRLAGRYRDKPHGLGSQTAWGLNPSSITAQLGASRRVTLNLSVPLSSPA